MFRSIEEIEVFINNECGSLFVKNNVKFCRVNGNHQHGDYICKFPDNHKNVDMSSKTFENVVADKKPKWKNLLNFSISSGRASMFLNRPICFAAGINIVDELKENYGSNKLHEKVFSVHLDDSFKLNSLTHLRGKIVADVLGRLINTCGGTIYENESSSCNLNEKPQFNIIVTCNRSCSRTQNSDDDNVIVDIGQVQDGTCNAKINHLSVEDYFKLRRDEISSMCEHKLDTNSAIDNIEDLVRTAVFFDLIQSNIHKSVTLQLQNQMSHSNTSCKGAIFVMYNYVRVISLISKFENLVSNKIYSPLPPLKEIEFSLLTQDAEWTLMFDFILRWPLIVQDSFENFKEGRPKIHNIFRYLMKLSSEFSAYYHHTRILTDSRSHLMSVVYARIHFLKAIAQVFKNALYLILLRPINKM